MSRAVAVISMLHEDARRNSATRAFRGRPVLDWTLARLGRAREIAEVLVVCREDQAKAVRQSQARILINPRATTPGQEAVWAASRWFDGWRGGLLGTCHFDEGFDARAVAAAVEESAENIVLVQPAAGLIDPVLVDDLVRHAREHVELDLVFTQAAPGLAPVILSRGLVDRLAAADSHPGSFLSYSPERPGRDPITSDACMAVPHRLARTLSRFTLDSERQIRWLEAATAALNGQLLSAEAEELVELVSRGGQADPWPREVTIELTVRRATKAVYSPGTHLSLSRGDMSVEVATSILDRLATVEDARVTFGGGGDPLLHPAVRQIIEHGRSVGIRAMHVETDLVEAADWLGAAPIDVLSVHLPALTPPTYQRVMGVDRLGLVLQNLKGVLRSRRRGVPIVVPTFTKCRLNLDEMEAWYDQWTKALGAAAIVGPSDFAGKIPDVACADMAGPRRRACRRLNSRMTILSDGAVVACEQDVLGVHVMGRVPEDDLFDLWQNQFEGLRSSHQKGQFEVHPLCGKCREWHRA